MCVVCVTVAGTIVVASQLVPVEYLSSPAVFQKTLTSFSASSVELNSRQKSEIESLVEQHPEAEKFICTGIRFETAPMSENIVVRKRAKAACEYAKQLNPSLSTWFQNKPTKAKSFAGKVLLTLRLPASSSTPEPPPTPTPTPTPSPTPAPTPTPEVQLPIEGVNCSLIGEKIMAPDGFMKCIWQGGPIADFNKNIVWRYFPVVAVQTSESNNYPTTPVQGAPCTGSGDSFDVEAGILECRWVFGKSLQWIKLNSVKTTFPNAKSPVSIERCKLQNSDMTLVQTGRGEGLKVGFPVTNTADHGMFVDGVNEVLVMPIDFPDFPGGAGLSEQLEHDEKLMRDWFSYFSNGKSQFNITSYPEWFRMSKNRADYPTDAGSTGGLDADSNFRKGNQSQALIDEITKAVDLRKFSTIYIIYPDGEFMLDDFIVRNHYFDIKEGKKHLNLFSWGYQLEAMQTQKWAYYIHETLHDFRIIGHAPGSGWPFGIMQSQSGISYAMNPYEQFLLDWLPADQIYCDDAATLTTATISLSPLEREDKQTKMALIRLSPTRLIVVESHGVEKWSSFNFGDRAYPPGFYSVMAYIVDLNKAVAPPVLPDGTSLANDDWAWAVWEKVDGGRSNEFTGTVGDRKTLGDYVAVLGDSFVIEGIRIKFVGTGDFETIEISKIPTTPPGTL